VALYHTALCVCVKWSVEYQLRERLDKQRLSDRLQYTTQLCWTSDHLDDTTDDYTGHWTDVSTSQSSLFTLILFTVLLVQNLLNENLEKYR